MPYKLYVDTVILRFDGDKTICGTSDGVPQAELLTLPNDKIGGKVMIVEMPTGKIVRASKKTNETQRTTNP